jgi:putative flippase GtrA
VKRLQLIDALFDPAIIRFAVTGVLNTCVGLGTIFLLKWTLNASDTWANLIGYCVGFTVSYFVNARWTFKYREALHGVVLRYAALIVFAYLVNLAVVHAAIDLVEINSYIAQTLGVVPYALITYLGAKFLVFVPRPHDDRSLPYRSGNA